jgi:Na+/proline symporter
MSNLGAFTWIDWLVVAAFMLATTWIGHLLRGKSRDLEGFFLGCVLNSSVYYGKWPP